MKQENGGYRSWFVWIVLAVACAIVCGAVLVRGSGTNAGYKRMVDEVSELRNVIAAQGERLNSMQKALDGQQAELNRMAIYGVRNDGLNRSELNAEQLGDLISNTAIAQSNLVVLVNRLLQKTSMSSPPEMTPEERRQSYAAIQATAGKQVAELNELKQVAADWLAQLSVPDDVSVMDPNRALDMLSLRSYWPYFEAKRKRDTARQMTDSIEMKMMQEAINLNIAEQVGR